MALLGIRKFLTGTRTIAGQRIPIEGSTEQVTGLSAVKALVVPAAASMAIITVESKTVRWRDDGTDPTTSVGQRLLPNVPWICTTELRSLRFIEEAASAKINVSYYK